MNAVLKVIEDDGLLSIRLRAIRILHQIFERQRKANQLLLDQQNDDLEARDRRFLQALVYGVLRHYFTLEADVSRFTARKPDLFLRCALFVGLYQLRYMRVDAYAAIHATVEAVKQTPFQHSAGFVNAVLRQCSQAQAPKRYKPWQRLELPQWLYRSWRDAFSMQQLETMAISLRQSAALCIAVLSIDRDTYAQTLQALGIQTKACVDSPYGLLLPEQTQVTELPGYVDGVFVVMDQSAQLAVLALATTAGSCIDLCAAPGGKTALLQQRQQGRVLAVERSQTRLPRLLENLARLQATQTDVLCADAYCLPLSDAMADAVLLDAPCSASGLFRRHPDARFVHQQADLEVLARAQKAMLREAARIAKPGASLVYAVCSIHRQENEQVIDDVLQDEQLELVDAPALVRPYQQSLGMVRIFPDAEHDGFFIACLRKKA